jgi:hypothetical protein
MIRKIKWRGSNSWDISLRRDISASWLDNWGWSVNSNSDESESWTTFNSHCWVWVAMDMNLPVSESWSTNA